MHEGIRFRPPPVELLPEIRWVLLRAFGPLDLPFLPQVDAEHAVSVAQRLGLGARIAARLGREASSDQLGASAERLVSERVKAVGAELAHDRTIERVAAVSARTGIPVAFLKSQALRLQGLVAEGSRLACDVDLLVARGVAADFQAALVEAGFEAAEFEGYDGTEQHLPGLTDPEGSVAEVHTKLLGVSLGPKHSVTFDELEAAGLLRPLPQVGEGCFAPATEVSVAYALAHGIAQHGRRPDSYAMLLMIGDLIDLGFDGEPGEDERLVPLLERSVSPAEVDASLELAGELARGGLVDGWGAVSKPARVLLRHILASRLDQAYLEASMLRVFHGRLSDRPRGVVVAQDLLRSVFPTAATLTDAYGPAGPIGRLGQRVRWVGDRLARLLRVLIGRAPR